MRRQMREIGEGHALVADLTRERAHLLMRALEEIVENAELVHDLERGGMNGVAAEIAQKIGVLLQHHDIDAGAGQQEAQHHAGRDRRRQWRIAWLWLRLSCLIQRCRYSVIPAQAGIQGPIP